MREVLVDKSIRKQSDNKNTAVLFIISSGLRGNLYNSSTKYCTTESPAVFSLVLFFFATAFNYKSNVKFP